METSGVSPILEPLVGLTERAASDAQALQATSSPAGVRIATVDEAGYTQCGCAPSRFRGLLLVALAASILCPGSGALPTRPAAAQTEPARLIVHQMVGSRIYPQDVRDNIRWIERERPFLDGVVLNLNEASSSVMRNAPLSYRAVAAELAPVRDLGSSTLQYNLAVVFNDKCADPFDDWSVCIGNWVNFARAVKDAGLAGIAFDNEEYFTRWTNYPDDCDYPERSLQEYHDQVRLRGRQVMAAVTAVFPDIDIITFQGPYVSEPGSPSQFAAFETVNRADRNELKGAFFAGFLEGTGSRALVIDGGGAYGLRYPEEFALFYEWRRYGIASDAADSAFIPPHLRPLWRARVSLASGLYNMPWRQRDMDAAIMGEAALNALSQADSYVWLYFEQVDLVTPGGIDDDWVDALRTAKETYRLRVHSSLPDQPAPAPPRGQPGREHPPSLSMARRVQSNRV
ncbi:MAG: hypothetical protein M5R40_21895 [Anaerolineae bacterium]|nr:hypothetical protein [Anaerolineae bacterium]